MIFDLIRCPVCGGKMETDGKVFRCCGRERRHCFDIASSGYINLLPPGKKNNAKSGDDRGMISARRDFLNLHHYDGISSAVGETAAVLYRDRTEKTPVCICDMGCAEGYHALNIMNTVSALLSRNVQMLGFDASKHGADFASKRSKAAGTLPSFRVDDEKNGFGTDGKNTAFFAAANIFSLPVTDKCLDFAVSMFAPVPGGEAFRTLKDDGYLIVAASGEKHLFEMREILYETPRTAAGTIKCPDDFSEVFSRHVEYKTLIEGSGNIMNLFSMTPFCYKTSGRDTEKLKKCSELEVTVQCEIKAYKKIILS